MSRVHHFSPMVQTMNNFYVYEHWRLDKDECFYVGKGFGRRAYTRRCRNTHWKNIVSKLERLGFAYEIRIVASGLTKQAAFSLEKERIAFWRNLVDLANITDGGEGVSGLVHSEELKQKLSFLYKGKPSPLRGKPLSEEHKKKLSESHKGQTLSLEQRSRLSKSLTGKPRSEETKQKISQSKKGKPFSELHRRALSESHLGKSNGPHSEETKLKMSLSRRAKSRE